MLKTLKFFLLATWCLSAVLGMNVEKQGHPDVVYHGMFNYMQVISHNKELETYRQYCLKQKLDPDDKETVLSNFQKFCCLFPEDNDVLKEIVLINNTGIYCKYELDDAFKYILRHQKAVDVMKIIVSQYFNNPGLCKMVYWSGRHKLPSESELAKLPKLRFMELERTSSWDIYTKEKNVDAKCVNYYDTLMEKLCFIATENQNASSDINWKAGLGNFNRDEMDSFQVELLKNLPDIPARAIYFEGGNATVEDVDNELSLPSLLASNFLKIIFKDRATIRAVYGISIADGEFQYDPLNYSAYSVSVDGFVKICSCRTKGRFANGYEMNKCCFENGINLLNRKTGIFDFYFN